jgi:hypothetical protein
VLLVGNMANSADELSLKSDKLHVFSDFERI